jgi:hypothetical protein
MTFEQVMEMNKRRIGQMHAAGCASCPARRLHRRRQTARPAACPVAFLVEAA